MKAKDLITGNILETPSKFIFSLWKSQPDRYKVLPTEKTSNEIQFEETMQGIQPKKRQRKKNPDRPNVEQQEE